MLTGTLKGVQFRCLLSKKINTSTAPWTVYLLCKYTHTHTHTTTSMFYTHYQSHCNFVCMFGYLFADFSREHLNMN
jgi:hypothetical protein